MEVLLLNHSNSPPTHHQLTTNSPPTHHQLTTNSPPTHHQLTTSLTPLLSSLHNLSSLSFQPHPLFTLPTSSTLHSSNLTHFSPLQPHPLLTPSTLSPGKHCEQQSRSCHSSPCLNGASCIDGLNGAFTCLCKRGYRGQVCGEGGPCEEHTCENGGVCHETTDGVTCVCPPGFKGALFALLFCFCCLLCCFVSVVLTFVWSFCVLLKKLYAFSSNLEEFCALEEHSTCHE